MIDNYRKISVITIVDKGSRFYVTALKSYLYQNYQNTEWIILDNTGRNLLASKIEKYLQNNSKIKLISNPSPLKKAEVLKQAFSLATGEYIAFLSPADYWVKDKLTRQIGFMTRYQAPLCHTSYAFGDDKCNLLPIGCYHVEKELNILNYSMQNPVCVSTLMAKKDKLVLNFNWFDEGEEKETDLMTFFLKSGAVSSGMSDVLTLCRPIFEKKTREKIEGLIKKVLEENPKDKNITTRVLGHHAYAALNVEGLKLDPSICIGYDVVVSLTKLRNFKI